MNIQKTDKVATQEHLPLNSTSRDRSGQEAASS